MPVLPYLDKTNTYMQGSFLMHGKLSLSDPEFNIISFGVDFYDGGIMKNQN